MSIIDQVENGYSPIILIVGKQRRGKSNMGVAIGNLLMQHFHNKSFSPQKNLFFDPIDLLMHMEDARKEPLIIDEAGVMFNAQEFYSHLNIAMNKIIQSQAVLNNVYILILPMAKNLAKSHRNFINFRLNMVARGMAIVHKYNIKYEDFDEGKKRCKFVFIERFCQGFLNNEVWKEYEELANSKKGEIRKELKNFLIAEKQKKFWVCNVCNSENMKGIKRCLVCHVARRTR